METIEIKCKGITRSCRQALLHKMYTKENPFEEIYSISLVPTEYSGYETLQVFVNDVDIGFIPEKETHILSGFYLGGARCSVRYSATGKPHYDFYLLGFCTYATNICHKKEKAKCSVTC